MCHTLSVSVEGLEMRGNGDHGVFLGMESQHLTNMVSVKTDEYYCTLTLQGHILMDKTL